MTDQTKPTAAPEASPPEPAQSAAPAPAGARAAQLAYLAHEIRNPMSTALWTAELLGRLPEAERGGERGAKLAAICLRSVGRVRLLVEDHLLCERLDAGGYQVRPEPVALAEALAEALGRKPADPVPVEAAVDPGLTCQVDRALLVRVLEGVVGAAAGGAEGVRIEAIAAGPMVEVRVQGGPAGALELPQKGAVSDPRGRALALPAAAKGAEALGGRLTVVGGAYLIAIPAT